MKKRFYLVSLIAILLVASSVFGQANSDLKTVSSVDLKKYVGKWYEIAKYPNRFQKKCLAETSAVYTQKSNGRIEVLNSCRVKNGKMDAAKGEAKIIDTATNAKLKVRFAPGFLSFIPFVWGDYWIIDLDANYNYAVVGSPSRDYLWILSRTPEIDANTYQDILQKIKLNGFEVNILEKTKQN